MTRMWAIMLGVGRGGRQVIDEADAEMVAGGEL
jgi:hypothetical protein